MPWGTPITFTGTFMDNAGDVHTAVWTFTSNIQSFTNVGTVNETSGAITTTRTFTQAGVFLVTLKVTDVCGSNSTASTVDGLTAMVVVYDPDGGFVTGGGSITSPLGAYVANPSLTGACELWVRFQVPARRERS
jgi:hypothetical protein